MSTPTKVDNIFFNFPGAGNGAIVELAANQILKSDELDVAALFSAQLFVDFAPTSVSAITVAPELSIQSTPFPTGNAGWRPIITPFIFGTVAGNSSAVDGTEAAGSTLIEEATTTGLANGQLVFFKNATLQNSEWSWVQSVSAGVSFTLIDGITNAQTGSTWFNLGQYFRPIVDLSVVKRLRAVVNNNRDATARTCALRVGMIQLVSVG